jgi:hypothetical protein
MVFRRRRTYRSKNYPRAGLFVSAFPLERPHRKWFQNPVHEIQFNGAGGLRTYMSLTVSPFP